MLTGHGLMPAMKNTGYRAGYRLWLPLLAFCLLSLPARAGSAVPERPNILIMILDDWGWYDSGVYGNTELQTPHIDAVAASGYRFDNMFLTSPECSPSRASILTGRNPRSAGAPRLGDPVPADRVLVSKLLGDAGYYTASVGKWHLGEEVMEQFDLLVTERGDMEGRQSGMEDWLDALDKAPADRPFFMWFAAKDPHRPWYPDMPWAIYSADDVSLPVYTIVGNLVTRGDMLQDVAGYYNELRRADFMIGQVMERLGQKGLLDNTLVILMSDNGAPFYNAKKHVRDAGLKSPFIMHWPAGLGKGSHINDSLLSAVDIAPTLLELAGLPVPEYMEGVSFAGVIENNGEVRDFVFGERQTHRLDSQNARSIRDKKFLYIFNDLLTITGCSQKPDAGYFDHEELYDVQADRFSQHNLASDESYRQQLLYYRKLLAQKRADENDLPEPVVMDSCFGEPQQFAM